MDDRMEQFAIDLETELSRILWYWIKYTPDYDRGGFVGRISGDDVIHRAAPRGSVLNARILWAFSAAYNLRADPEYLVIADRAYQYMARHFVDNNYGGVYWTVDADGKALDTKKQIYAIAFTIYAFSEYFMASGMEVAREHAVELYEDLVKFSLDRDKGGYFEAFGREWEPIADLRLSEKDENTRKTMNTHLHVLEAFSNLYRIWPDDLLQTRIADLLEVFKIHIVDQRTAHLKLFFDENWQSKSDMVSYGHDIEAAWLMLEAAEMIGGEERISEFKSLAVQMALAVLPGLDADGGLWYELDPVRSHLVEEKHWWVQAEGLVGFFNAWQISTDEVFLDATHRIWEFIQLRIIDHKKGEWVWGIQKNGSLMLGEDKVGLWKCPYHNSRACIELIKRMHR